LPKRKRPKTTDGLLAREMRKKEKGKEESKRQRQARAPDQVPNSS
jgi:hypothetical protein